MLNYFVKKINNKKGFTLVELVVVIAILGILAAIAVPKFASSQEQARINSHNTNVKTLESAAVMFVAEKGFPDAKTEWKKDGSATWGNYIQAWPSNPTNTGDYTVTFEKKDGVDTITVTPELVTTTP